MALHRTFLLAAASLHAACGQPGPGNSTMPIPSQSSLMHDVLHDVQSSLPHDITMFAAVAGPLPHDVSGSSTANSTHIPARTVGEVPLPEGSVGYISSTTNSVDSLVPNGTVGFVNYIINSSSADRSKQLSSRTAHVTKHAQPDGSMFVADAGPMPRFPVPAR